MHLNMICSLFDVLHYLSDFDAFFENTDFQIF